MLVQGLALDPEYRYTELTAICSHARQHHFGVDAWQSSHDKSTMMSVSYRLSLLDKHVCTSTQAQVQQKVASLLAR